MKKNIHIFMIVVFSIVVLALANGCQDRSGNEGIHVMFKGTPKIYRSEVYFRGQIVGTIHANETAGENISMITIEIDPEYHNYAGSHWAFYIDSGRLTAGRLNLMGNSIKPGDLLCGFNSKTAFNWFKVKNLLRNKISKASRRAEKLHRQFTHAG